MLLCYWVSQQYQDVVLCRDFLTTEYTKKAQSSLKKIAVSVRYYVNPPVIRGIHLL